jgi:hypothetical protein
MSHDAFGRIAAPIEETKTGSPFAKNETANGHPKSFQALSLRQPAPSRHMI